MNKSDYVYGIEENKGIFGSYENRLVDTKREEEIINARRNLKNSEILEGVFEIGFGEDTR
jgi:hypothetical protein